MVDTRVEEYIRHNVFRWLRLSEHLSEATVPSPVVRDSTPTVGDNKTQVWELREQVTLYELHECRRVAIDVVRACGVVALVA